MTITIGPNIKVRQIILIILVTLAITLSLSAYVKYYRATEDMRWCVEWNGRTKGAWVWDGERCVIDEID